MSHTPVDVARELLSAAFKSWVQTTIQFHRERLAAKKNKFDFNSPPKPPHVAVRVPTGTGKSEINRSACLASYIQQAKLIGDIPPRALVAVSTHRLAHEARQRVAGDISTALWQSRKAHDVITGEPLCLNLEAVKAAEAIGADVERTCCRKPRKGQKPILCPFYAKCGYQVQKVGVKKADIIYCAHECLFAPPPALTKKVGIVVIDESFWQDGLSFSRLAVDRLGTELQAFPVRKKGGQISPIDTAQLASLIERLQQAVGTLAPTEYLTRQGLLNAGLLPGDKHQPGSDAGAVARKLEWRRKVKVDLAPDSSVEKFRERLQQFQFLGQIPKRVAMWRCISDLLCADDDATGRLRSEITTTEDGSVLYLKLNLRHDIHRRIANLPVVVLDATLNINIVKFFLPRVELLVDLEVDAPHERIIQVVGLPVGKASLQQLEAGRRSPEEEKRVANKRKRLADTVRIKIAAGRDTLVITNKELESLFTNTDPNIEIAHFNAIEGLDRWRNVEVLVVIGRPLPSPKNVEDLAAALTGKPVTLPEYPPGRPNGRPQKMLEAARPIRLKSGSEVMLTCRLFELPEAELIRQAVTEAQLVQAIGRARGVNRTASNPVEAWLILDDTTVPIAIDAVVQFCDLEPTKIDLMIEHGLVPQWSMDAFKLYPGLWGTSQAARKAYQRDGLDVAHNRRNGSTVTSPYRYIPISKSHTTRLIRYQPKARGGGAKWRLALVNLAKVPDVRVRIESVLGELAVFEDLELPPD